MYRLLIVDDEKDIRENLRYLIDWEKFGITAVLTADSFEHAVDLAVDFRPHIALVDVNLGDHFGYELVSVLRGRGFDTCFCMISGYDDFVHVQNSMKAGARDYLLKPISPKTLYPILDQLYLGEQRPQDGLTVKGGKVLFRIPFSQLAYVEVNHKHLYFNLTDGSVREVAGVLKQYEDQLLAREEFMRIHRSYIVNMLQIETFAPTEVRTFSGKFLPISRLIYPQLQKDYLALLFKDRRNPEESIK